jgi:DNA-binding CsgD family transcriptional regulator
LTQISPKAGITPRRCTDRLCRGFWRSSPHERWPPASRTKALRNITSPQSDPARGGATAAHSPFAKVSTLRAKQNFMSPEFKLVQSTLLDCCAHITDCEGPSEVLERLNEGLSGTRKLRVLGAARLQWNRDRLALGETLFPHKSVDAKWWREYIAKARVWNDPVVMLARVSLAPFTWSESQRALGLVGAERWVFDLCTRHGIRDALTCPIGGRWMVSFWSPQTLLHALSPPTRAALYAAASCAAVRLEQLLGPRTDSAVARPHLTPRELAVLRWASLGRRIPQIARALELGPETVRTHMKKAREKLDSPTTAHAVAEAMRWRLFS